MGSWPRSLLQRTASFSYHIHSCFPLPAGAAWTLRQAQKNMHARALCKEQLRQAMTSEHFAAHLAETVSDGEQVAGYGVGRMS